MPQQNNAVTLLNRLRARGVQLWQEQGKLNYRAPQGTLSTDDITELKQAKQALLRLLIEGAADHPLTPDSAARYQPFPLTDVQGAYLLGRNTAFGYGGVACHVYLEVSYPHLEPARVTQAWDQLVARHDMLRATFDLSGSQQVQSHAPSLNIPCRHSGPESAQTLLDKVREEMGHRRYAPDQWPLFSLALSQLADNSVLHLSMDFLIADWASIWLLLREFETYYAQPQTVFPPLTLQFRDYLLAERRQQDLPAWTRDKTWWMARIDSLPTAPQLPTLEVVPQQQAHFSRRFLQINDAQWQRLKRQSAQRGITPTAAVLTAYACVLQRWSSDSHFCLNLTVLNRQPLHPQVDQIVGDFTAVSLLEVDHRQPASYGERATALSRQLFDDLDHRLCSGVEVMREISRRHGREKALMPYVFTSAIGLVPTERDFSLQGKLDGRGITQTPQVFIDCQAMDSADGLQVNWDVRDGVFPPEMVDELFASFHTLLIAMAEQDDVWAQAAVVPLPPQQHLRRQAVNATEAPLPQGGLHLPFFSQAERTPDALAVKDAQRQLSYRELQRQALAVSQALRAAGIRQGERVAITLEKGIWQAVAVLGAMAAGAVWLPLDITQPWQRRASILQDAEVSYVLSTSNLNEVCDEAQRRIDVDCLPASEGDLPVAQPDSDAPAYIIYTSGSTGTPKGVVISHRAALNTLTDINQRFSVNQHDRVLALAQLGFDLAVYDLLGLLAVGGALIYPHPDRATDPSHWLALIDTDQVTIWNSVPALMQMLDSALQSSPPTPLSSLRLALLSGDWVPLSLPEMLAERLPNMQLVVLGGATEAAIWSNYHLWHGNQPGWRSVPYGRPLANQGFCVLDAQGEDCPEWVSGDLYISGAGLALGYLNDAEKTARQFVPHPRDGQRLYSTGDRARYLPSGELEFLGRSDNQLKIKGHRIEPGEIEAVISRFAGVASACVVPHGEGEQRQLLGIVTGKRQPYAVMDYAAAADAVASATTELTDPLRPGQLAEASRVLDGAVLSEMRRTLAHYGLLQDFSERRLRETPIRPAFYWLLRRWQAMVTEANDAIDIDWHQVQQHWQPPLASGSFLAYIRSNLDQLSALLEGDVEAHNLLFPQGEFTHVRALYRQNLMAQYLNRAVSTLVAQIATGHQHQRPLRILEIGAGTGGTTEDVLAALAGIPVEYTFTDVSPFFLPEARSQFGQRDGMRFALLNIDVDIRQQGFMPESYDVVLAAGVLENTRQQQPALARMQLLTAPQGWLIITEPTREHPWVMASQAFMMTPPEDEQRQSSSYLDQHAWQNLLQQVNNAPVLCLPPAAHPLGEQGFHLLAQRIKSDRQPLPLDAILAYLQNCLPAQMIPAQLQCAPALALTANGKLDRRQMAQWWVEPTEDHADSLADSSSGDPLEQQLQALWAEALGVRQLGLEQDFYDLGADSLIMARMAGKLRQTLAGGEYQVDEIPFDALLRHMLNGPSVTALAAAIRSHQFQPTEPLDTPLHHASTTPKTLPGHGILLPFGGGSQGPLRVVFHAGLGTMDCFRPLLAELDAQQRGPVLGMVIADTEKYCQLPPQQAVEQLADDYADRLLATGHSRFQLIGYCLGGLFAIEVARRLIEQGVEVDDLVLISSHPVLFDVEDDLMIESLFIPNLHITLSQAGFAAPDESALVDGFMQVLTANQGRIPQGALNCLPGAAGALFSQLAAMPIEQRFARYVAALEKHTGQQMPVEMALGLFRVFRQSFHAARFSPSAYTGDIRFLLPREGSGFAPGMDDNTLAFWREICLGEFTVTSVNGNHFSCIDGPQTAAIAARVAEGLQ